MFQSCKNDDETEPGTLVEIVERHLSTYASSADEAESALKRDVQSGKLPKGKVYQICPSLANTELIRSISAGKDGTFARVFLDPASGLYGTQRRIRLPRPAVLQKRTRTDPRRSSPPNCAPRGVIGFVW